MPNIKPLSDLLNWRLLKHSHDWPGPDGGTCINEAAIVAAGFKYRALADQVRAAFARHGMLMFASGFMYGAVVVGAVWLLLTVQSAPAQGQECCSYKGGETRCLPCRPSRPI